MNMMKIKCYELKTPTCGHDYFSGGYSAAREWEIEHYATEAEALDALKAKREKLRADMAWAGWWLERYDIDEDYTVRAVTVEI